MEYSVSSWTGCSCRHTEWIPSSYDFLRGPWVCSTGLYGTQPVIIRLSALSTPTRLTHRHISHMMQIMWRHNLHTTLSRILRERSRIIQGNVETKSSFITWILVLSLMLNEWIWKPAFFLHSTVCNL